MMKLKFDGFILALIAMIILAYIYPELVQAQNGQLFETISTIGVSLIFFFYGLKLSFREIKDGLKNWKLHVCIQLFTFALFPLIILIFRPFIQNAIQEQFWLSFYFLAALPSTVSSSVVMVSIARGNVPAAIFNASISGLIGVVVTPLLMEPFIQFEEVNVLGDVYWGLIKEIIIPVILGLLLQPYLGKWASKYSKQLSKFDKAVILSIVYSSLAESFLSDVFHKVGTLYLTALFIAVIVFFFLVYGLVYLITRYILKFNREDQITALFCGSKKSLTHGSVFSKFLFAGNPNLGLYFLPLMVFHAFQIFVVTIIAQRYANQYNEEILTKK